MNKNSLWKLSSETLEIVENFYVIKKLHDQFQSIGQITEELFDELSIPKDTDVNRVEILELRRSEFIPR